MGIGDCVVTILNEYLKCSLGFICKDKICEYMPTCSIYQKVKTIAKCKCFCFNCSVQKNKTKDLNGKAKRADIRNLYLDALKSGFICPICNTPMIFGGDFQNSVSVDHIVPRGLGGKNRKDNYRLICVTCNQTKSEYESIVVNETKITGDSQSDTLSLGIIASIRYQYKLLQRSYIWSKFVWIAIMNL
jgi:5-methylcytosine-specific restriction endonuclease McrA